MDSTESYNPSQSFIDLLNSQQEINNEETNPSIDSPTPKEAKHKQRWTLPEEKVLVSAWLNTSKDCVVGNEQKGLTFWNRVAAYYAASPSVAHLPVRESNTCKQKWSKINEQVGKFAGCYEYASREHRSGETEDDVLELAYKLYFQDHKVKFTLEHCWRLLKNDQKWCSLMNQNTRRTKGAQGSTKGAQGSQVEEEVIERPMGVKQAKAKGKKRAKQMDGHESSLKELDAIWAIKEKDLAIKERISKQKLLDSLILKQEPLSQFEETLKNHLISEMCVINMEKI